MTVRKAGKCKVIGTSLTFTSLFLHVISATYISGLKVFLICIFSSYVVSDLSRFLTAFQDCLSLFGTIPKMTRAT